MGFRAILDLNPISIYHEFINIPNQFKCLTKYLPNETKSKILIFVIFAIPDLVIRSFHMDRDIF